MSDPRPERVVRDSRRQLGAYALGLFVLAFALRLYVAHTLAGEPVWDGQYYDFGARHIASGFGYADEIMRDGHPVWHPWCHYPVGYSGFLAVFYRLFGATRGVAHVANALVGGLLPVVTYLLAREALSPWRARIAGALVALHPGLVLYGALVMSEPLAALLVLAAFYVTLRVVRAGHVLGGIAAGAAVLGVAALVRPQGLLCVPFLVLAIPWQTGRPAREQLRRYGAGLVVAGTFALLPVLPWTARNCRVMDSCALVSTNGGWNLAIGSFPRATGRFETLRSSDGCRDVTGQVQQDRCWLAYGIANIERAPGHWLSLVPAKLGFTFDHESFAVEYLHEARPRAWPDDLRARARAVLSAVHRVLVVASALAFIGLALGAGERRARVVQGVLFVALALGAHAAFTAGSPTFWPIVVAGCVVPWLPLPGRPAAPPALLMSVALVATTVATHAIFFGEDRYHIVVSPVLCLLAASALRWPASVSPSPRSHDVAP